MKPVSNVKQKMGSTNCSPLLRGELDLSILSVIEYN